MKLLVCESCEAEFYIKHNMNERYYKVTFCSFCGVELSEELEDEVDYYEDYDE